jgi:hypothetical protein
VACLAGGRNKLVAAKAYDFFNAEFEPKGTHTLIAPFEEFRPRSCECIDNIVSPFGSQAWAFAFPKLGRTWPRTKSLCGSSPWVITLSSRCPTPTLARGTFVRGTGRL